MNHSSLPICPREDDLAWWDRAESAHPANSDRS